MKKISIITDGAYSPSRNLGGIGVIILKNNNKIAQFSKSYKDVTNNKMEILAVIMGLRSIVKPVDEITIYTDSQYVIGCGFKGWKRKKNQILWRIFDMELKRIDSLCKNIFFQHVKGHTGNQDTISVWQDKCDKLAVQATL